MFEKIFKEVLNENPEYRTQELEEFVVETFQEAARLEIEWAESVIGEKFDGITMKDLKNYIEYMANKRCNQIGFGRKAFPDAPIENPLRWIIAYQEVDLGKTDFFEQKSRQYTKASDANGFDDL